MEIQFDYTRPRREFGQHPRFSWQVPEDVQKANSITAKPDEAATWASRWVERMVSTVELDCTPVMAQHQVNTEQFTQASKGTLHTEGAWPNDVKLNDPQDKVRLLRRYKNEASYQQAVPNLVRVAETAVLHNNAIDLYEEYFTQGDNDSFQYEPPSCKTAAVFRDPSVKDGNNQLKRAATRISWHPDGSAKLAVSYSVLQFQAMPANLPLSSYIWDVNNPNQPDAEILPQSPLSCLVYNPKSPDHLVGGSYNGLIGFWDLRKGSMPVENSLIEKSHKDPVYDVHWIQSRTGNECCSVSTDGQVLWWDIRKLAGGPTDNLVLTSEEKSQTSLYGGTCMEYKSDAGATRYLVGTEQGVVLLLDRKPKKDAESQKQVKMLFGAQSGKHYGRIYSVQRNPVHSKYFLTIGDWTARVWMEDLKAPIMTTKFDSAYLTGGCWSTTRPGLFFTTKIDGTMDVWDFFHKQNDCIFSTKVSDAGLSSIRAHQNGKLVALGSMDGSCTVLELSDALSELQKDEKAAMGQIFEREQKREKNLELRSIQRKKEKKEEKGKAEGQAPQKMKLVVSKENDEVDVDKLIKQAEENFFKAMQSHEEPEKVKADSSTEPATAESAS